MVSIKEIKSFMSKEEYEDYYGKFLIKIAVYPVKFFSQFNISANQITFFWITLHIISLIFFIFGEYEYIIAAILLLFVGDILDYSDGPIARIKKKTSTRGAYLEKIGHHLILPYLFLAIAIGIFIKTQNILFLFAGFIAALNINIMELTWIDKESLISQQTKELEKTLLKRSLIQKIYKVAIEIYTALHSFILFFFVIINRLDIFIVFAAIYSIPILLIRIIYDYLKNLK